MSIAQLDYPKAKLLLHTDTDPEKQWRAHGCEKEPWTVAFIEAIEPGGVLWDVGANVGTYTLIALACDLRVVAIEPGFHNYARLCENLALNNMLHRPIIINGALGAESGMASFYYGVLGPGYAQHSLGVPLDQGHHSQQIPVYRLDDLSVGLGIEPGPHYLKIDVDGGEAAVLDGAAAFLSRDDVRGVVCEMPLATEAEITAWFKVAGWPLAERHAPRQEVCYGIFRR